MSKGESYIFRHALIRDTAYNGMLRGAREQTHGRIADMLENDFPEQVKTNPAAVAHHFAEAGIFTKVVNYGIQAAKMSLEGSLNDETIAQAEKVFQWVEVELNINLIYHFSSSDLL